MPLHFLSPQTDSIRGHFQPQEAPDKTPVAELVSINSQTDTWQEYAFVCYSCDSWTTFNPTEKSHPLIWARGLKQTFETATTDARIQQHDHYSKLPCFHVNHFNVLLTIQVFSGLICPRLHLSLGSPPHHLLSTEAKGPSAPQTLVLPRKAPSLKAIQDSQLPEHMGSFLVWLSWFSSRRAPLSSVLGIVKHSSHM
jgi:hypothetical protein